MKEPSTFTASIALHLSDKLRSDLEEQGFAFTSIPHAIFCAKKKGIVCTLYQSGKLVVQGKEMRPFIEFYLEPEILQDFCFTNPDTAPVDLTPRIGMDEAGKGDFFGPLCIAALFASTEGILQLKKLGVQDSKRFSDESVLKLARKLRAAYPYVLIRLFPQKYNELYAKFKNLNRLLGWAHATALRDLHKKTGCKKAILDQFANKHVVELALQQQRLEVDLEQRVRGEEDPVVAAASILARAAFLEGLDALSREIDFTLPKGAGPRIIAAGKKLMEKYSSDLLEKLAKTHFKTTNEILDPRTTN